MHLLATIILGGLATAPSAFADDSAASFVPLANLDALAVPAGSFATGLSSDGSVVVGSSFFFDGASTEMRAFRWTAGAGMSALDSPTLALPSSFGWRVNGDGTVVVGSAGFVDFPTIEVRDGTFWPAADVSPLAEPIPLSYVATDVTDDGALIVGGTREDFPWVIPDEAFAYTDALGAVGLGKLAGGSYSQADAVSADGSVIVGHGDANGHVSAWRWSLGTGMQLLAGLTTIESSEAAAVSADGTWVVGYAGDTAYRWSVAGGVEDLGALPGTLFIRARDVSANGGLVVGVCTLAGGDVAFVWDAMHGMRALADVLTDDFGLDLTGWDLLAATAISDDGETLAGHGINPGGELEAWVATGLDGLWPGPWSDQGCALAGVTGDPSLVGSGALTGGSLNTLALSNAAPSAMAALFAALSSTPVPFKGGTLKPFPFLGPFFFGTDPSGAITLPFILPGIVPSGTELWTQWAVADGAAVNGVALSNTALGITP
jgi:uncharacterized membrane protein